MSHDTAVVPVQDDALHPIPDPGLEPHAERWTDADRSAGDRAYRQVLAMFALVPVLAIAFIVIYFAVPKEATFNVLGSPWFLQTVLLGLTGGLATLLVGVGLIHWARQIMSDVEIAEDRHPIASTPAEREGFLTKLNAGIEDSGVPRRKMLLGALGGALGIVVLPPLVTLLDVGVWPTDAVRRDTIERTIWAEGVRIMNDANFKLLKAADIEIGQLVNAQPENLKELHAHDQQTEKAKAALIVVRMDPASIRIPPSRQDWHVGGILAYSKICTHVGCPISLWEQQTHHLLCPCHQSTFDLGNSGVVVFGPAARSLPQLPIAVDSEGYLVARSDFTVPVGPSYFERDSSNDYKDGDQ